MFVGSTWVCACGTTLGFVRVSLAEPIELPLAGWGEGGQNSGDPGEQFFAG